MVKGMNLLKKVQDFSEKQKKIFYLIVIFIALDILLALSLFFVNAIKQNQNAMKLEFSESVYNIKKNKLISLNKYAKKNSTFNNEYAFYKFSEQQRDSIKAFSDNHQNIAIVFRFELNNDKNEISFSDENRYLNVGFLDSNDFSKKGKFNFVKKERVVLQFDVEDKLTTKKVDLSFSIKNKETENSDNIPYGFYIQSYSLCKITSVCVAPSQIGFDKTSEIPFWAVSSYGGKIDKSTNIIDFTGTFVPSSKNSNTFGNPVIYLALSKNSEDKSTLEEPKYVSVVIGGEKLRIKNVLNKDEFEIPINALKNPLSQVSIVEGNEILETCILKCSQSQQDVNNNLNEPIEIDPGLILNYDQNKWRNPDFELYKWDRFDGILFFDMKNFTVQSRYFTRLAFFIEKEGYKGRLLTNEELNGKHGYNAHDYSGESLAYFFNTAYEKGFTLNVEEENLKRILIHNGLLISDENNVLTGKGGIVSISRESPDWSRKRLLAHEGWHTLYFSKEEFRNYVAAVYYTIDPKSLQFLHGYFSSQSTLGYDTNDNYLMQNEFMAYIMQQPISEVAQNFLTYASWNSVIRELPQLCSYIKNTEARAFEDAAIMMTDFVFDNYGIVAGDISLINR
jgi:hypothetical protein